MAILRNPVSPVWWLRLDSGRQAPNVEVVICDVFATPNLLKSQGEINPLFPYSNKRAITSKLCAQSRLAIIEDH
jgi:hypothetical protein